MGTNRNVIWFLGAAAIFATIYFYFLPLQTRIIYGDDLNIYMNFSGLHNFRDRINMDVPYGKFRPVHDLAIMFLIETFGRKLSYYYLFNVLIQALNTVIFAITLRLFIKPTWLALLFSILLGLSRFSFFNISQLLNGGALEGLAMTFFLLFLFSLLKTLGDNDYSSINKQRGLYLAILFANLSMYTHERYIVLFPFIIFVVLQFPGLKVVSSRQKTVLIGTAAGSVLLNIFIKKSFLSLPFFVGTGGTNMSFSISSALSLLGDALLSVFQINSGPGYLAGISFSGLTAAEKILPSLLLVVILILIASYFFKAWKDFRANAKAAFRDHSIMFLLLSLFILFLAPAVSTIRLEQRWLQAPLSILLLMLAIASSHFHYKNGIVRSMALVAFIILFSTVDISYFRLGADRIYLVNSEKLVSLVDSAIKKGTIRSNSSRLFIWEDQKDPNTEAGINWDLGGGSFFDFYMGKPKRLVFVDSVYENAGGPGNPLKSFHPANDQLLYLNDRVADIGNYYVKDSLKTIRQKIAAWAVSRKIQYDQHHLVVGINHFEQFATKGFYEPENNFRWTNGNAELDFLGDFQVNDSLTVLLNTFMPPVCKDVSPVISIMDENGEKHLPSGEKRVQDQFLFSFYFKNPVNILKINIVSDTIHSYPDKRVLSFPFLGLELNK